MVVTCEMKILISLTQISAKFPSFFSLAKISLFRKIFLRKLSREDFHFFFVKIFFSVSVISLVYILYTSKTIKQSKTFQRKFLRIFCFSFAFQQSARTFFYWKRGYFDRL